MLGVGIATPFDFEIGCDHMVFSLERCAWEGGLCEVYDSKCINPLGTIS